MLVCQVYFTSRSIWSNGWIVWKNRKFSFESYSKTKYFTDVNKNKKVDFFEDIYNKLLREYGSVLSDSQTQNVLKKQIRIADSTTISLFEDILSCVGRKAKDGKSKGEIKVYTVINADTKVPSLVWFSLATINDHNFLDKVE